MFNIRVDRIESFGLSSSVSGVSVDEMSFLWPFLVFSRLFVLPEESIAIEHDMNQGISNPADAIRHLFQVVLDPTVWSIVKDSVSVIVEFHTMADIVDKDCFTLICAVLILSVVREVRFCQCCIQLLHSRISHSLTLDCPNSVIEFFDHISLCMSVVKLSFATIVSLLIHVLPVLHLLA